jgi:hypothetical protein
VGTAPFRCLSFITEFVEVSFDAATDFLVLKMYLAALGIFRGIFGVREGGPAGFCVVLGLREARGGSFGVTKPKRYILVAI